MREKGLRKRVFVLDSIIHGQLQEVILTRMVSQYVNAYPFCWLSVFRRHNDLNLSDGCAITSRFDLFTLCI
jgi:hypothetical protein